MVANAADVLIVRLKSEARMILMPLVVAGILSCGVSSTASAVPVFVYVLNGVFQAAAITARVLSSTAPSPGPSSPIAIKFDESPSQMTFSFSGGDINNDLTFTVAIAGKYWTGTASFTEGAGIFFDDVSVGGNFTHILGPHPKTDGFAGPMQFDFDMTGLLFDGADLSFNPNPTLHPNTHHDTWSGALSGTTSGSDIIRWSGNVAAVHAAPVPGSLALVLGTVLAWKARAIVRRLPKLWGANLGWRKLARQRGIHGVLGEESSIAAH